MVSVTSEAAASAVLQIAPAKPAKRDASQGNESFAALVDNNTPVENSGNDRATSTPQQQSASQRRTEDAAAPPDNMRSRDAASADRPARNTSDDRDTRAENYADADTDPDATQQTEPKSGAPKADSAKTTEKPASETTSAADGSTVADASAQQDAAALIIPNPVAVAIAVAIVSTNISPAAPPSGNAAAPLAIAAAAIAATTSAAPAAPAAPSAQVESDSGAAASAPTSTAVATDPALTATVDTAAAPGPKARLLKATVFTPTKIVASGAPDTAPGPSDPSTNAASGDAAQENTLAQQQTTVAARQEDSNGAAGTTKADAPSVASPATPAAASAHEHSPLAPAAHPATNSSDTAVQATGAIQPPLTPAPASVTPPAPLSVTLATNAAVPMSGLALEIAASVRSGKSRFEIRLDPADLGRIDVRIDVDRNGQVTSHLTVEKPETLSMLRQDAPQLQRQLDDAGFKIGNGGLQFSLRDQSSSGRNDGNETGSNAQRLVISDEDTIPAVVAGRTYGRVLGSSSGVDIRV